MATQREEFNGNGELKCYGEMSVDVSKWDSGTGSGACRPEYTNAAPQGFIADGEDGSHWVKSGPTVFFQRHTAPTKIVQFQKCLHWQVGNELTFIWVLFVATRLDLRNGKCCI